MKNRRWILWLVVIVAAAALAFYARKRIHFNWAVFATQLRHVSWVHIAVGVAMIWLAYVVRATRWSIFLKPTKRVSPFSLIGTQVIGFTAVALFGRLADLVRPYLVAKRTRIALSSQVAVYTVERMFDMGAMAVIFSSVLLFSPDRHSLPRPDLINKVAIGGLLVALALALFAGFVRVSGRVAAGAIGGALGSVSPKLGEQAREKILAFRDGLNAIGSVGDFLVAVVLSLLMWAMIASAYFETTRAFTADPVLGHMSLAQCMLLMAASMASSAITLPIIGWFTQIGLITAALEAFFHVAPEPALGCGAMLLVVTFLSVIPLGLIWASKLRERWLRGEWRRRVIAPVIAPRCRSKCRSE